MPCFNEERFVSGVLQKVIGVLLEGHLEKEIIITKKFSKNHSNLIPLSDFNEYNTMIQLHIFILCVKLF